MIFLNKFNPQRTEKIIVSLRLPKDKVDSIDMLALNFNISRNEFLMQCIDYALENIADENIVKGKKGNKDK